MRPRNKKIYLDYSRGRDMDWLKGMQQDYRDLGFDTELKDNILTVFALPRGRRKKKEKKK